jgi:pyridoxine/pyridoxamine 5'-phosphate oxidase
MKDQNTIKELIQGAFQTSRFAVLATEGAGQPHTSLVAITSYGNFRQLIFATYRNTLKYRNLAQNSKVAVFIEGEYNMKDLKERVALTIIGHTQEVSIEENEAAYQAHLKRHPEMESFLLSPDCTLILVIAKSFQVVSGIDEIRWITEENLNLT